MPAIINDGLRARLTTLLPDAGVRAYGRLQAQVYRLSSGRLGGSYAGNPVLTITTTGRRSGEQRTTTVLYVLDRGRPVVVGSNTGSDRDPAWALNLIANPEATVQIRGAQQRVRARVVEGQERDELWRRMNEQYGGFDVYRERTDREIKTFVLDPIKSPAT
jgi:deazaflavin-dependent oxidoreductase (nitroreductase family)